ncbi:MAG: LemA family protein [Bacteroidales bacterium]|nr:LemA family protein [Bacteroidales bacterium]
MKKGSTLVIILICIAVLAIGVVKIYNNLVKLEENVKTSWSQVENNYQRRSDLIPNLVATVKGYAGHEESTLTAVIEARSKASQITVTGDDLSDEAIANFQKNQNELGAALGRLLAVSEAYPELKANENFLDLQVQLEGTENRISESRRAYNETAQTYNTKIRVFPDNIIAGLFGFQSKGYFKAEEGASSAPEVQF